MIAEPRPTGSAPARARGRPTSRSSTGCGCALAPGLNVLTGETGAGKSLLIDALGLALGARADSTLVRHGAEGARVEALFDRVPEPLIASARWAPAVARPRASTTRP